MRKETKYAIIIAAGTVIVLLDIWFSFGELNPFYVVASGSMIPNLRL
jgi:signal peptidase I